MEVLLLRLDAPIMSFGGVMVDHHGPTDRFPGTSLLAGLFGNALGFSHGDAESLAALQGTIEYAARWDVPPIPVRDYHTVDLGQKKMRNPGWTTRGVPEHREGGPDARFGTHQRYRHYLADGVMTVAVAMGGTGPATVSDLAQALKRPVRPLFLGRKTCLPAAPLLLDVVDAPNVLAALKDVSRVGHPGRAEGGPMEACWPVALGVTEQSREVAIYDRRDWSNQVHTGRRLRVEGLLEGPGT